MCSFSVDFNEAFIALSLLLNLNPAIKKVMGIGDFLLKQVS